MNFKTIQFFFTHIHVTTVFVLWFDETFLKEGAGGHKLVHYSDAPHVASVMVQNNPGGLMTIKGWVSCILALDKIHKGYYHDNSQYYGQGEQKGDLHGGGLMDLVEGKVQGYLDSILWFDEIFKKNVTRSLSSFT